MVIHFTSGAAQGIGIGTVLGHFLVSSSPLSHSTTDIPCPRCGDQTMSDGVISSCLDCFHSGGIYVGDGMVIHFTRAAGQEIGTGTVLDHLLVSSPPSHATTDIPCPRCGDQTRGDGVIYSCLDCFLSGGDLYRFEYGVSPAFFLAKARGGTCTLAKSSSTEEVLHRALFLLENGFGDYHVFKNNCENFAMYCKTGLLVLTAGWSGQAASYFAAGRAVASSPLRRLTTSLTAGWTGQAASYFTAVRAVASPLRLLTTSFAGLTLVDCGIYCVTRYVSDIGVRGDVAKVPVEMLIAEVAKKD